MDKNKNMKNGYAITKEAVGYLVCGVLSMAVSWAAMLAVNIIFFGNTAYPTPSQNAVLGFANWMAGMLSAFFLTRALVFRSDGPVFGELARHTGSRFATLVLEFILRQAFGLMGLNLYVITLLATGVSTAVNYVLAKLVVFRKHDGQTSSNKNA